MAKRVKNNDTISHVWCGQEIQPNEYYSIQEIEYSRWASSSILLTDIVNGIAIMNDGSLDITEVNTAINFLKDLLPIEAIITEQPPFAQPLYRTKRNATGGLATVTINSYEHIDFKLTTERYVSGGCIVVENAVFGDYVEAEVIDVDSVIPEAYRAALCENWPTVAKYIEKEWVKASGSTMTIHEIDTSPLNAKITANLYLRVTYNAIDSGENRRVGVNYYLTKKL